MIELILAMSKNKGIGYHNILPWKCKQELAIFSSKITDTIMIVGRKTFISLPPSLKNLCCVVGKDYFKTIEDAISYNIRLYPNKKIFIIGGSSIYNYTLTKLHHIIDKIHISIMKCECLCDSFVDFDINNYNIESQQEFTDFSHYVLLPKSKGETQYLNLLKNILHSGKNTYGRNGSVVSQFVNHLSFDLREGFPLLTTKKMLFRGIVEELLFFLRGETDSKILEEKGINIWKGNTNKEFLEKVGLDYNEGDMGPMYGYQWRKFNAKYKSNETGIDQLENVINMIKTDPKSRRILMTDFNPLQVSEGVLYPCHSIIIQFFVEDGFLDMYCFNRSSDLFLGLPFNIASSSLLLIIIAKMTQLTPRFFNLSLGDCHIYESHIDNVKEQIQRLPYKFPTIKIEDFSKVEEMTYEHINLSEYIFHPTIKAQMIS